MLWSVVLSFYIDDKRRLLTFENTLLIEFSFFLYEFLFEKYNLYFMFQTNFFKVMTSFGFDSPDSILIISVNSLSV